MPTLCDRLLVQLHLNYPLPQLQPFLAFSSIRCLCLDMGSYGSYAAAEGEKGGMRDWRDYRMRDYTRYDEMHYTLRDTLTITHTISSRFFLFHRYFYDYDYFTWPPMFSMSRGRLPRQNFVSFGHHCFALRRARLARLRAPLVGVFLDRCCSHLSKHELIGIVIEFAPFA